MDRRWKGSCLCIKILPDRPDPVLGKAKHAVPADWREEGAAVCTAFNPSFLLCIIPTGAEGSLKWDLGNGTMSSNLRLKQFCRIPSFASEGAFLIKTWTQKKKKVIMPFHTTSMRYGKTYTPLCVPTSKSELLQPNETESPLQTRDKTPQMNIHVSEL